jgi:hypothetical protein
MDKAGELDGWLREGSLGRAHEANLLGEELAEALRTIDSAAVRTAFQNVERTADLLGEEERAQVADEAERLAKAARALLAARTAKELRDWSNYRFDDIQQAAFKIAKHVRQIWQTRCSATFQHEEQLGTVLSAIRPELARDMLANARAGKMLGERFPPGPDERSELDRRVRAYEKRREELLKDGADESVLKFLLRVADDAATLADVSTVIQEWLRRNDALEHIRLRF